MAKKSSFQSQLAAAQEKEKRALADYQNLIRRQQQDRAKLIQLANRDLIESLLPSLENLETAAAQLKDNGLELVLSQIKQVLAEFGVEEIEALGKEFDVELMEAVESKGEGQTVKKVLRKGYKLNGLVIQHAKVVLG